MFESKMTKLSILLVFLTSGWSATPAIGVPAPVSADIEVFPCARDSAVRPDLRLSDVSRPFAEVVVAPTWARRTDSWEGRISVPAGHYIVESGSLHCSGETEQWVAIPGELRHIVITLNKSKVLAFDEDSQAGAIYGELPSPVAQVEVMSADSVIGEQTRRSAAVDGYTYQIGHLRSGRYVVLVNVGNVAVTRVVDIPPSRGATVRADLTAADLGKIVRAQAAGSGFVTVPNDLNKQIQTFKLGHTTVGGWISDPLDKPAEYSISIQRLGSTAVQALVIAQRFLAGDARVPNAFRQLVAWDVGITDGGSGVVVVALSPVDPTSWAKSGPKNAQTCFFSNGATVVLVVDNNKQALREADVCQ
jgi:hypothetical protein